MRYRIGVDTGGTFVDVVVSGGVGRIRPSKFLADPDHLAESVISAIRTAAEGQGLSLEGLLGATDRIVHGSTVATNALLTGNGATVGLVTTSGFRDVLNLRRGVRSRPMDSRRPPPQPLIPRRRIHGVVERIGASGEEVEALDPISVEEAVRSLEQDGVESVAVCLMFSFLAPAHEHDLGVTIGDRLPEVHLSLSSEVLAEVGFYERLSTTAINAFVSPLLGRYLHVLVDMLDRHGFGGRLLVMQSNGGVASAQNAAKFGARSVLSGPAAAPVAIARLVASYGLSEAISVDMGGTSFDVCLIHDGRPNITVDGEVAGHRIALPMIAIHTIGAGGGSIVGVDSRGLLTVGPSSAGADPGPACYGRGALEPTVTDANVLLGYVAPESFWGGRLAIDVDAARQAMTRRVGDPLGIDATRAAFGAYRVVNENMVDAIREVSIRRGFDPREFVLVAAGGAGALHIAALADELEIPVIIVPRLASVLCAYGGLLSDLRYEASASLVTPLGKLETDRANDVVEGLRTRLVDTLVTDGVADEAIVVEVAVDVRYAGQFHDLEVPLAGGTFTPSSMSSLVDAFHERHEAVNGYHDRNHAVDVTNVRVRAIGRTDQPPAVEPARQIDREPRGATERRIYWDGEFRTVSVFERSDLAPGTTVAGPAVVTEETTTLLVTPAYDLVIDALGNAVMHRKGTNVEEVLARLGGRLPGKAHHAVA
jgi:N-methylhydantoinase A